MTPPKRTCSSMEDATALARSSVPRTIPKPVSSQEDSMPRTRGAVEAGMRSILRAPGSAYREIATRRDTHRAVRQ
ncbi:hypothetical protein ACFFX0_09270 [Citricoccus parietis]|uniref:Uncharacterized protein n=1 Tax=Citricoccus parietis TaxID=592307 RepID=A0ABV5FXH3_9MICC